LNRLVYVLYKTGSNLNEKCISSGSIAHELVDNERCKSQERTIYRAILS